MKIIFSFSSKIIINLTIFHKKSFTLSFESENFWNMKMTYMYFIEFDIYHCWKGGKEKTAQNKTAHPLCKNL